MSWRKGATPPLRSGKHPTNRELQLMRLGYPEYQPRLLNILNNNPERYAAVMAGAKSFSSGEWVCPRCSGVVQYTRNLACRDCSVRRSKEVFYIVEPEFINNPLWAYRRDDEASERYQKRAQQKQYLDWFKGQLMPMTVQCGSWRLERGVLFQPERSGHSQYLQPDLAQHERYMLDPEYLTIIEFIEKTIGTHPNENMQSNTKASN